MTGETQTLPTILETVWQIDRYGAEALGLAPLGLSLSRRLSLASDIFSGYKARLRAKDWVEFAKEHGAVNDILIWAERVAREDE